MLLRAFRAASRADMVPSSRSFTSLRASFSQPDSGLSYLSLQCFLVPLSSEETLLLLLFREEALLFLGTGLLPLLPPLREGALLYSTIANPSLLELLRGSPESSGCSRIRCSSRISCSRFLIKRANSSISCLFMSRISSLLRTLFECVTDSFPWRDLLLLVDSVAVLPSLESPWTVTGLVLLAVFLVRPPSGFLGGSGGDLSFSPPS